MNRFSLTAASGALVFALTSAASAGPMSVAPEALVTSPPSQIETIAYRGHYHGRGNYHTNRHYRYNGHRHYRHYGYNPGAAAAAGLAFGALSLGAAAAASDDCGYYGCGYGYGGPYYGGGYGYGAPAYGYRQGNWGGGQRWNSGHYAGYAGGGGLRTGRSVGFGQGGGGFHGGGGGFHGGAMHGGGMRR
ncbi:hypothetical protein Msil_1110 [Methylocella silvestris BL2]|uniref:Uncharacterized protein n=1 Tax=Methylocella silvestris (strain DSM 15510 / CIP 108128 / LMG 27833 / NCIMB 13906 / BL2) TaxID=395965 RepID=B8ENE8_METSB|nr:hypothetical protein [Methylocella silvestris]ACK50079.1 hypothetical protein Msil_1110 [Methylocella silvestris BL2]